MHVLNEEKIGKCKLKHLDIGTSLEGVSFRGTERFDVFDENDKVLFSARWHSEALDFIQKHNQCKK